MEENGVHEEVLKLDDGRRFFTEYTPILVDAENTGLVIIVKNSEEILKKPKFVTVLEKKDLLQNILLMILLEKVILLKIILKWQINTARLIQMF